MSELKPRIHDEDTGVDYILAGDYYIPAIELPKGDDRPIGKWTDVLGMFDLIFHKIKDRLPAAFGKRSRVTVSSFDEFFSCPL